MVAADGYATNTEQYEPSYLAKLLCASPLRISQYGQAKFVAGQVPLLFYRRIFERRAQLKHALALVILTICPVIDAKTEQGVHQFTTQ
jgi:hypothetical protein